MSKNCKINIKIWLLALLSSVLLSLPYIFEHMGLVSLIALIPLFAAEQMFYDNGKKHFFFIAYTCFLVWNLITTYWVWYATQPGAAAAFILNSLQMAIIFMLFRWMRRYTKGFLPYIFFCITYLAWEHSYFTWQVSWPWLVLGNSFASSVKNIQWYEYTGTLGGSLWILLVNTLLFRIFLLWKRGRQIKVSLISLAAIVIFPITISHIMYYNYKEESNPVNFGILQPNIDPYTDKFGGLSIAEQTDILYKLAEQSTQEFKLSDTVNNIILIAPETFIYPDSWRTRFVENSPTLNSVYRKFHDYVANNSISSCVSVKDFNVDMIIGAVAYKEYSSQLQPTPTSSKVLGSWYDRYNAAIFISKKDGMIEPQYYHKSKLVILAESNPFINGPFKFMDKLVSGIAGGIGNFGTQPDRTTFACKDSTFIGTAICYESIFGDFYRHWALNGANVMTIITNDGWWRNTPGHKQHLSYARLRAIENRRSIARCANTGISAFINQRGDVIENTKWWERCYLNGSINKNNSKTIFTVYGDIIGRVSRFLFFLFVLMGAARTISKKYIIKESLN